MSETKGISIDEIRYAKLNIPEGIHFASAFEKGSNKQEIIKPD